MTEETTANEATGNTEGQQQPAPPQMRLLGQFTRDLSFENVSLMKGEKIEGQPQFSVGLQLEAKPVAENAYDLIMKIKVDSKTETSTVFVLELDYVGRFQIANVQKEHVHPFLMVECARILFPFARRVVMDVARDGGHIGLNLDPVDFIALYRQTLARQAQAQAEAAKEANQVS